MKKVLIIALIVAIATAVLTSCSNQQRLGFYNGNEVANHLLAPITSKIQAEKAELERKKDSLSKVPGNENEVEFINSQLKDWNHLSIRKLQEAVEPVQDSMNKKIEAALKKVAEEKSVDALIDVSLFPVTNVKKEFDFTNDVKKHLK